MSSAANSRQSVLEGLVTADEMARATNIAEVGSAMISVFLPSVFALEQVYVWFKRFFVQISECIHLPYSANSEKQNAKSGTECTGLNKTRAKKPKFNLNTTV